MTYSHTSLGDFAETCLIAVGLSQDRAQTVATVLVEAEMMGHDTHGLALLPAYVRELQSGAMRAHGSPDVLSDRAAASVWDGNYLPGPWLTVTALDEASRKARTCGVGSVAIRRSHHVACLQAYLLPIVERGQVAMICCSDPRGGSVAPFGGIDPVFTPNPVAYGIPTAGDPILIDVSTSITTNGMTTRLAAEDARFGGQWALDAGGRATDDPKAVMGTPPGALLPVGGLDHGHKGYALSIAVEALTQGLSGYGRADPPGSWGASVFIQVFEPDCFTGLEALTRQTANLVSLCRASRPIEASSPVRLPGESALAKRRRAVVHGLELRADVAHGLTALGSQLGVAVPAYAAAESTASPGVA